MSDRACRRIIARYFQTFKTGSLYASRLASRPASTSSHSNIRYIYPVFSTLGRIDAEFFRLMFYHAHRESEFFKLTGPLAQPNQDSVSSKLNGLKPRRMSAHLALLLVTSPSSFLSSRPSPLRVINIIITTRRLYYTCTNSIYHQWLPKRQGQGRAALL